MSTADQPSRISPALVELRIICDDMIRLCDGWQARANLAPDEAEADMAFAIVTVLRPFAVRLAGLVNRIEDIR